MHVSVTSYPNDGMASNGHTYSYNQRHFGPFCAINRHGPFRLGDRIALTSRCGGIRRGSIVVTACDMIGHGSDIDLDTRSARAFMGPRYRVIGRVSADARLVSRAKQSGREKARKRHGGRK